MIIIIFISLPSITNLTFSIFNCIDIFNDGDTYLAEDMSIKCWDGTHGYYAKSFGIPIILVWVIGFPTIAFFILLFNKKRLSGVESLRRYGFLYVGLNHKAFYWEILLHFRKVLMISINVFFTTFQPLYRVRSLFKLNLFVGSHRVHANDSLH